MKRGLNDFSEVTSRACVTSHLTDAHTCAAGRACKVDTAATKRRPSYNESASSAHRKSRALLRSPKRAPVRSPSCLCGQLPPRTKPIGARGSSACSCEFVTSLSLSANCIRRHQFQSKLLINPPATCIADICSLVGCTRCMHTHCVGSSIDADNSSSIVMRLRCYTFILASNAKSASSCT